MNGNDFLLNGGFALGGGLGSMPVATPYLMGGAALSPEMQQQMMPMGMTNRTGQEMLSQPMTQQQPMQDPMAAYQDQMRQQKMYEIMGKGIQGMGRSMQQPMPSGNTAQIMRDQSRPQFAGYVGSPQQQMAMALRNRGG